MAGCVGIATFTYETLLSLPTGSTIHIDLTLLYYEISPATGSSFGVISIENKVY
jgi:hypothetical protein